MNEPNGSNDPNVPNVPNDPNDPNDPNVYHMNCLPWMMDTTIETSDRPMHVMPRRT